MANKTHQINGLTINYAKLATPVKTPFGTEQYEAQLTTTDAATAELLKAIAPLASKVKEEDGVFSVNVKAKAFKQDGTPMKAPMVVNGANAPIDASKIGNGSTVNVILSEYDHTFGAGGTAVSLAGVQVTNLVEYTGGISFAAVDSEDAEAVAFK